MDLSKFEPTKANQGAVMSVLDPTTGKELRDDDGSPVTVTVLGVDSQAYRDFLFEQQRDTLHRVRGAAGDLRKRRGRGIFVSADADELLLDATDADTMDQRQIELATRLTVAWSGIVFRGAVLECTEENKRILYEALAWLREQVVAFLEDRANYLGNA